LTLPCLRTPARNGLALSLSLWLDSCLTTTTNSLLSRFHAQQVITLTDCTAATSQEGQDGATKGTFGMFSKPMTAEEFNAELSVK